MFEGIITPENIATGIIFYLFARIILAGLEFGLDVARWKLGLPIATTTQVVNGASADSEGISTDH
jgi:hypothetical protein